MDPVIYTERGTRHVERECNEGVGIRKIGIRVYRGILKKEFGGGEEESVKAAKLRKLEQEGRTMEEFVQEFKRAARSSRYEGRLLVEEFKRGMNGAIRRKLIEVENQPGSIEQWFRRAIALD